jgi:hypothetical protein
MFKRIQSYSSTVTTKTWCIIAMVVGAHLRETAIAWIADYLALLACYKLAVFVFRRVIRPGAALLSKRVIYPAMNAVRRSVNKRVAKPIKPYVDQVLTQKLVRELMSAIQQRKSYMAKLAPEVIKSIPQMGPVQVTPAQPPIVHTQPRRVVNGTTLSRKSEPPARLFATQGSVESPRKQGMERTVDGEWRRKRTPSPSAMERVKLARQLQHKLIQKQFKFQQLQADLVNTRQQLEAII